MKLKQILYIVLMLLSLSVLWGLGDLSWKEWTTGHGCPKVFGVPACYILLVSVVIMIIGLISKPIKKKWFYIGAGMPWIVALVASLGQLFDVIQCPKSDSGMPMCYLSLLTFSAIWLIWILREKIK